MEIFTRYCAIKGKICEKEQPSIPDRSCFLAYPFKQPYLDITQVLERELTNLDYHVAVPKPSRSATGLLFCDHICPMMIKSRMVVCEVTLINHNVFFEMGYAYGLGKEVYLIRNQSQKHETNEVLDGGIYINHYETPQDLIETIFSAAPYDQEAGTPKIFNEVRQEEVKQAVAVLTPKQRYHNETIRNTILECVNRHQLRPVVTNESGIELLQNYRRINSAEWVIGDFVSDNTNDAPRLNSETAFFLGLSLGLGKKVIIIQEEPVDRRMIDLAGLIDCYKGLDDIRDILSRRLDLAVAGRILEIDRVEEEELIAERALQQDTEIVDDEAVFDAMEGGEQDLKEEHEPPRVPEPEPKPVVQPSTIFSADFESRYEDNVEGPFYVNDQCIDCDLCRETAPDNFLRNEDGGYSYVFKQAESDEERELCEEAMEGCPVEAIGSDGS